MQYNFFIKLKWYVLNEISKLMHHCQNIRIAIPFLQLKYFNEKNSDAQQLFFSFSLWACYYLFILFSRMKWKISRILHWGFSFKAYHTNIWYIIGSNLFWSILTFFFINWGKRWRIWHRNSLQRYIQGFQQRQRW